MSVNKPTMMLIVGYLIGSFFGISALLALFGGVLGRARGAASGAAA